MVTEEQVPAFTIHHDFRCCVIHHYAESKVALPVRTGFIVDLPKEQLALNMDNPEKLAT
jgi:hypothetical protein